MAVTKIRKISSGTLLISSIISIIVLGMFYAEASRSREKK